jgi:hypothetical protein
LAEALRSRGVAETRLRTADDELTKLREKTKNDSRALRRLESECASLTTRLRDREHELREKRKLVEVSTLLAKLHPRSIVFNFRQEVQDEMITLGLQLTLAEKERDKVKADNKDLVDRWMKRMAQEADAMNLANEPHNHDR